MCWDLVVLKDGCGKLQFVGAGDADDAFVVVFLKYFSDAGRAWENVDVVVPLSGKDGRLMG